MKCHKYQASVTDTFAAAHNLVNYQGACEKLHGHNYSVTLVVGTNSLNRFSMVADFRVLKRALRKAFEVLDHTYLNELPQFEGEQTTAERIAVVVAELVKPHLPQDVALCEVRVCESEGCCVSYFPDGE